MRDVHVHIKYFRQELEHDTHGLFFIMTVS